MTISHAHAHAISKTLVDELSCARFRVVIIRTGNVTQCMCVDDNNNNTRLHNAILYVPSRHSDNTRVLAFASDKRLIVRARSRATQSFNFRPSADSSSAPAPIEL